MSSCLCPYRWPKKASKKYLELWLFVQPTSTRVDFGKILKFLWLHLDILIVKIHSTVKRKVPARHPTAFECFILESPKKVVANWSTTTLQCQLRKTNWNFLKFEVTFTPWKLNSSTARAPQKKSFPSKLKKKIQAWFFQGGKLTDLLSPNLRAGCRFYFLVSWLAARKRRSPPHGHLSLRPHRQNPSLAMKKTKMGKSGCLGSFFLWGITLR